MYVNSLRISDRINAPGADLKVTLEKQKSLTLSMKIMTTPSTKRGPKFLPLPSGCRAPDFPTRWAPDRSSESLTQFSVTSAPSDSEFKVKKQLGGRSDCVKGV